MRLGNQAGRLVLITDGGVVDVAQSSDGAFGPDPAAVLDQWPDFLKWASGAKLTATGPLQEEQLRAPSPAPRQVFGIGANYRGHVEEVGWALPEVPLTFTKFPSSVTGPFGDIELTGPRVDWEVEAVVVIGATARRVPASKAWDHVAGITLGQDISDRDVQNLPKVGPQYSLGKSLPGFAPTGPYLVTPDEFANRDSIELACSVNGEQVQHDRTGDLVFTVPALIEYLSGLLPLLPGDLIFTGTPAGVGLTMDPPRFLGDGDVVESTSPEIGTMRHRFFLPHRA